MGELPEPDLSGKIDPLFDFLNVPDEEHRILLAGFIVGCFNSEGTMPVLGLIGPKGTIKTGATRLLKRLIDPSTPLTRSLPRKDRDLWIAVKRNRLLTFDNVSKIPDWMSDELCRVASGGGFGTRQLYTDDGEVAIEGSRPMIINGIKDFMSKTDLVDRSIVLDVGSLPATGRRRERTINAAFEKCLPGILGSVLRGVQMALKSEGTDDPEGLPRLADFAAFAMSAMPAFGWTPEQFLTALANNQRTAELLGKFRTVELLKLTG
jgi:hypothetical protein